MKTVTIHKAKTQLSKLIEQACRGEEIVIARGSEPVVRLVAIQSPKGDRKPGALRERYASVPNSLNRYRQKNWILGSNGACVSRWTPTH
jgi:prevent-host-death family protein